MRIEKLRTKSVSPWLDSSENKKRLQFITAAFLKHYLQLAIVSET